MSFTYVFTGRVLPERVIVSISEFKFEIPGLPGLPRGTLFIEIIQSQIFARFISDNELEEEFTLRNLIEDVSKSLLDALGFFKGYAYDVEIVHAMRPDTGGKRVFGIDIPILKGACDAEGVTLGHIFAVVLAQNGIFFRRALADLREAIKSPQDTGFFCYRAIESLMRGSATRQNPVPQDSAAWSSFRMTYNVDRQDIDDIKQFADPVRHGNYSQSKPMTDQDRADILKKAWKIVNQYLRVENPSPLQIMEMQVA